MGEIEVDNSAHEDLRVKMLVSSLEPNCLSKREIHQLSEQFPHLRDRRRTRSHARGFGSERSIEAAVLPINLLACSPEEGGEPAASLAKLLAWQKGKAMQRNDGAAKREKQTQHAARPTALQAACCTAGLGDGGHPLPSSGPTQILQ